MVVLLGNGDGTFQAAVSYGSGGLAASSVAVADVNGDGKPDLVVGAVSATAPCADGPAFCPGVVGVLLGNGDGSFRTAVVYASGGQDAVSVAVGDVNGDGKADLIVANLSGVVGVLLGNGDGTFLPAVTRSVTGAPVVLTLRDVNGDGRLDLVVANPEDANGNGTVDVLLGNGNGTFQSPVTYSSGGHDANSVATADVNGDGKLDLLVADTDVNGNGTVEVLLGNGDGTFQPRVAHGSGVFGASSVIAGDVNGDGKLDLIVASSCSTCTIGAVGVLLGNGDGTFQPAVTYSSGGSEASFLAISDLNGDGRLDVLVANGAGVGVLLGNGNGTFQAGRNYRPGGFSADAMVAGDVNGDGKADLVVASLCASNSNCSSGSVGILLGNGDGTFPAAVNYGSGGSLPLSLVLGDVNGDGKLDLIVANQCASKTNCPNDTSTVGMLGVLLGNGDGTFQPAVSYSSGGYRAYAVALGDVNGDGKLDLVVVNSCVSGGNCANGLVSVLLGNGDGTFQPAVGYGSGGSMAQSVAVEDLNGDGKLDLIVANYCGSGISCYFASSPSGVLGVLLGNGDGTFQPAVGYSSGGYAAYALTTGDVNADGKADLIVANRCSAFDCANSGGVAVLLGNGDGSFQSPVRSSTLQPETNTYPNIGVQSLVLADFNGDGKLDVASSGNSLLLGNGDGTFQAPIALGPSSPDLAAGDFNGDGKPDLAIGGVTVLLNLAANSPYATTIIAASSLNPVPSGQSVTFTAVVTPSFFAGTLSGSVTFYDGATALGAVPIHFGHATFSTSSLAPGPHSITAAYSGDSNYQAAASSALTETVLQPAPQPVVAIGASLQQGLTKDSAGNFVVRIAITNNGNVPIASVQVTMAGTTLGQASLLSVPAPLLDLAPGASARFKLKFPPTAAAPGATTARLKVSGTYSAPSVTPSVSGNWGLNFRGLSLP